ncbi:CACTA en-spm transposon protein [Cucumis melo var. makuwa]|uniref:CACTA en-spm transposon protein n=1 Tax=Cucumis melo var. makuwa TaxID=1194695 RepID=A0A5D3BCS6_CUCMM|nr:CACTA en-spm transposon protein [Cucumis melo var. makuwa]
MGHAEMDDVENEQLNVLEIVIGHQVDEHIEDDTLLDETNAIFLEFVEDLDNLTEGSSSTYDNSSESNGVCVQKTFSIRCLKWANVGREYIKVVKGDLQVAEDAHNQMLELKSQPIPKSSQPLSRDEICETVLGRRSSYSKGLSWGPKPKVCKTTSASSATTSTQSMIELQLRVELDKAKRGIEEQTRKQDMLASRGSLSDSMCTIWGMGLCWPLSQLLLRSGRIVRPTELYYLDRDY